MNVPRYLRPGSITLLLLAWSGFEATLGVETKEAAPASAAVTCEVRYHFRERLEGVKTGGKKFSAPADASLMAFRLMPTTLGAMPSTPHRTRSGTSKPTPATSFLIRVAPTSTYATTLSSTLCGNYQYSVAVMTSWEQRSVAGPSLEL